MKLPSQSAPLTDASDTVRRRLPPSGRSTSIATSAEPEARTAPLDASTGAATQPRFEGFPDRYQNQATELAEPIATF